METPEAPKPDAKVEEPKPAEEVKPPPVPAPPKKEEPVEKTAAPAAPQPLNPLITTITKEVKNKSALTQLAKQFSLMNVSPQTEIKSKTTNWFSSTSLANVAESGDGSCYTIDVQPDMRFPLSYMIYTVRNNYHELMVNPKPVVSVPTLIAFFEIQFSALLLSHDITSRTVKSNLSQPFRNDNEHIAHLELILDSYVDPDLALLLEHLAAFDDPLRRKMEFVPCFASFRFTHDYGRLVPPQILIAMHNVLSTAPRTAPLAEILRLFYSTLIITVNNRPYTVSHFLGGYFRQAAAGQVTQQHQNWLNSQFEQLITTLFGYLHLQRPTMTPIPCAPEINPNNDINPYILMTAYDETNSLSIIDYIKECSAFVLQKYPGAKTLRSLFHDISGITVLTHSIEPATLPTWHYELNPDIQLNALPHALSDFEFANRTHFLRPPTAPAGVLPLPDLAADQWTRNFYHVSDTKPDNSPFPYTFKRFATARDVLPNVLLFAPYDYNSSRASVALTLGIKIEAEEFDGLTIPTPNPAMSLVENNSFYTIGSVPVEYIHPTIPTTRVANAVHVMNRSRYMSDNEPLGFAYRDMSLNALPVMANVQADADHVDYFGLTPEHYHQYMSRAFTQCAWTHEPMNVPPARERYLWSSYRHSTNSNLECSSTAFYFSLQGLYGIGTPLASCPNPAKYII